MKLKIGDKVFLKKLNKIEFNKIYLDKYNCGLSYDRYLNCLEDKFNKNYIIEDIVEYKRLKDICIAYILSSIDFAFYEEELIKKFDIVHKIKFLKSLINE